MSIFFSNFWDGVMLSDGIIHLLLVSVSTVTWQSCDSISTVGVSFCTIQQSERSGWRHCRNRVTWLSGNEGFHCKFHVYVNNKTHKRTYCDRNSWSWRRWRAPAEQWSAHRLSHKEILLFCRKSRLAAYHRNQRSSSLPLPRQNTFINQLSKLDPQ